MKKTIIKLCLWILNTEWLNPTPGKYAFVGGIDAISLDSLKSNVQQEPHMLVMDLVRIMESYKSCPVYPHVHENGEVRPMNDQDIDDLKHLDA